MVSMKYLIKFDPTAEFRAIQGLSIPTCTNKIVKTVSKVESVEPEITNEICFQRYAIQDFLEVGFQGAFYEYNH